MPLEVRKNEKETNQSLLRRFLTRFRMSGITREFKKHMFYQRPKSENLKRKEALWRLEKKKEIERLQKLGKL